ncbi:MAG: flagellar basal body rod protein FlgC [Candidatus Schekmanbacteria bacterium]|nr:MAG: flagellar basal body rod protein FlgC [Candidatus Schekmanbacteria bacterium]
MDFLTSLQVSASALEAQRMKMNLIASNLANAETTKTAEGGPYKKKIPILAEKNIQTGDRRNFKKTLEESIKGVEVVAVVKDGKNFKMKYDPGNPDADSNGFVKVPDINVMEEMVKLLSATRAYEANVTAINAAKNMAQKALDIGK